MNAPTNARAVALELRKRLAAYPRALSSAIYTVGLELKRRIIRHPIPRRDGVLARSVYVTKPSQDGGDLRVEVGANTVYARRQHEEHKTRRHYIKTPFENLRGEYAALVKKAMEAHIAKRSGAAPPSAPTSTGTR